MLYVYAVLCIHFIYIDAYNYYTLLFPLYSQVWKSNLPGSGPLLPGSSEAATGFEGDEREGEIDWGSEVFTASRKVPRVAPIVE